MNKPLQLLFLSICIVTPIIDYCMERNKGPEEYIKYLSQRYALSTKQISRIKSGINEGLCPFINTAILDENNKKQHTFFFLNISSDIVNNGEPLTLLQQTTNRDE